MAFSIMRAFIFLAFILCIASGRAAAVKVSIAPGSGLLRDGKPYFIKGAGAREHFDELVKRGGNSVRTWGDRELAETLEQANKLKFTVCAGIWLEPECTWFSYRNAEHCERQLERVRKTIREYREHPSLLLWGLGNESEGDGRNDAYWQQINRLAKMVHQEDPAHPTFTAVAGLSPVKTTGLNKHTPDLDLVGINTYGALPGLREHLKNAGWTRPWVVTEFGPRGFWESPKTAWNAPLEQISTQKADMIRGGYEKAIAPGGMCAGSYLFIWGQKQEATSTWFGVFTKNGETTATADVMEKLWSGRPPANSAPELKSFKCSVTSLKPLEDFTAEVKATDPDGDALKMRWEIADDSRIRDSKSREIPPSSIDGLINSSGSSAKIKAPNKPGPYRVFVYVLDGKGHAATANVPIQVVP